MDAPASAPAAVSPSAGSAPTGAPPTGSGAVRFSSAVSFVAVAGAVAAAVVF
jgi:hypothetical protein